MKGPILIVVLFLSSNQATPDGINPPTGRLENGMLVPATLAPWHVELEVFSIAGVVHRCAGSLVTTNWVLTCAQCIFGAGWIVSRLGSTQFDHPQVKIEAFTTVIHPSYNNVTLDNNIALIRLSSSAPLRPGIQTIRLPPRAHAGVNYIGTLGTVSGFRGLANLLQINVNVVQNALCNALLPTIFCAHGPVAPFQNVCYDTNRGAALMTIAFGQPAMQIGVVSITRCAASPTTFTNIAQYLPWISMNTGAPLS